MNSPPGDDDATIEPVPPSQIRPDDLGLPAVLPKEIAQLREKTRTVIACGVLVVTGLVALLAVGNSVFAWGGDAENIDHYFTALVGLSGAIIGWYFGGRESRF